MKTSSELTPFEKIYKMAIGTLEVHVIGKNRRCRRYDIDGTSREIYPQISDLRKILLEEPFVPLLTHSNGCRCCGKNIRYVESGFMGHLNNAKTLCIMRRIGTELCFPEQCVSMGETTYPNGNCKLRRPKLQRS